jgi:hypothetical protein
MQLFRVITLLFISFSLIFGNFANAAMLCCAVKDQPAVQMQMNKAEMPCHKTVEKTEKKMQHDKSCANCKNCVSANVIIFTQPTHQVTFANIKHSIPVNSFSSVIPESIYSPPKHIS